MSMVSRRVFLKCIGVGSAAVASAVLLGGCSGGNAPSSSSSANSSNSGNNNSGSNNSNFSSSSSSAASDSSGSSSSASSDSTITSGDIGNGKKYRCHFNAEGKENPDGKFAAVDQGVSMQLQEGNWFENIMDWSTKTEVAEEITLEFAISNQSEKIEVPAENVFPYYGDDSKSLKDFRSSPLSSWPSKYMEAYCGSQRLNAGVASIITQNTGSPLKPGEFMRIFLVCHAPARWMYGETPIDIRYTLPYDTKKYVNFIIYPSDVE